MANESFHEPYRVNIRIRYMITIKTRTSTNTLVWVRSEAKVSKIFALTTHGTPRTNERSW